MKIKRVTLIEFIIVLIIIFLISSIIFPMMNEIRWKYRRLVWQEQTGITCDINHFKEAFVGWTPENKIIVDEKIIYSYGNNNIDFIYEKWKELTGNTKEFSLQDFDAIYKAGEIEEISFDFYVKSTGNPRNLTSSEFIILRKNNRIDFPYVWEQHKILSRLEK